MAWLKKIKGTYYACWRADASDRDSRITKTTKVRVNEAGLTAKQAEKRAQAIADKMEQQAKAGITEKQSISVKEYLASTYKGGQQQNQSNAERAYKRFLDFLGDAAQKPLESVKRSICEKFLISELARVSAGTVDTYRKHLSAAFNRAYHDELINRNPWTKASVKKIADEVNPEYRGGGDKQEREPFTMEEMSTLLNQAPAPWCDLVAVSFFTGGQRIGDCVNLTWEQVDFESNTISIQTQKTAKKMLIPLLPVLKSRLEAIKSGGTYDGVHVFPEFYHMNTRSKGYVSSKFTSLLELFGIDTGKGRAQSTLKGERRAISKKSFHSIRHTVATQLRLDPSVTPDLSRAIVGHDSESVEQGYVTAPMDAKLQALASLAQKVQG